MKLTTGWHDEAVSSGGLEPGALSFSFRPPRHDRCRHDADLARHVRMMSAIEGQAVMVWGMAAPLIEQNAPTLILQDGLDRLAGRSRVQLPTNGQPGLGPVTTRRSPALEIVRVLPSVEFACSRLPIVPLS